MPRKDALPPVDLTETDIPLTSPDAAATLAPPLPFWERVLFTTRGEPAPIVRYVSQHEALFAPVDFGPKAFITDDDPGALHICVDYTTDARHHLQPHEIDRVVAQYSGTTRMELHTGLHIQVPDNTQILLTPARALAQQGIITLVPSYGPGLHTIYCIFQALDLRDLRMKQHLPIARLVAIQGQSRAA